MEIQNAIKMVKPEPDSQFRLVPCRCGSDNVAYVQDVQELWRTECFDCGNKTEGKAARHDAQLIWNQMVSRKAVAV